VCFFVFAPVCVFACPCVCLRVFVVAAYVCLCLRVFACVYVNLPVFATVFMCVREFVWVRGYSCVCKFLNAFSFNCI